MKKQVIA